ncbi:MAG: DUF3748 domain-containing protein [Verrucomicrobia bacterium]|nr:DUF3748 domain-containing protein [Verrucomicrobiota bacterium]
MTATERQITRGPGGRLLTNTGVWSPDSEWIAYDTRSDAAGDRFDGNTIEMVHVRTGEVRELYCSQHGAHCGVVTFHPRKWKVVFILGPENPTPDWQYSACHRQGVIVAPIGNRQSAIGNLDARDLTPPFTPGALRGGSHVHVWDAAGDWVSFTYEDHVLSTNQVGGASVPASRGQPSARLAGTLAPPAKFLEATAANDVNLRNVGVSVPLSRSAGQQLRVPKTHPRNHDGSHFSVLVTRTTANPRPGSDEIKRAFEEAWVGTNGYTRRDGSRQRRALAFQGHVVSANGETLSEVFIADLPEDMTTPGDGPLCGTETRMPFPPQGVVQRRLTFTAERKFPGLQGPRHWLRSSPDGSRIAFLMKDDAGIVQLWTVSPNGGAPAPVTRNPWPVASAFSWSPDGRSLAYVMDHSVCVTDAATGRTARLTPRADAAGAPRPEACVFSPDGKSIAYVRRIADAAQSFNQIFIAELH